MSALEKLIYWLDTYREVAFDLLRIYLGVGLFVRGVLFLYDSTAFIELLPSSTGAWYTSGAFITLVALVHLAGGVMMAVGFWTRLAALAQVPILVGAVVFSWGGLFSAGQSFEFSTLVLFLLVLVFLYGSGRWSIDYYWGRTRLAFQKMLDKLHAYRERAFDLMRIYLGIGLFVRGVLFLANSEAFRELLGPSSSAWLTSFVLIHYVALAHLFGGAMMTAGLLTRLAALIQIPVLLGAVFIVHFQGGLLASSQSFEFSVLVLLLLVLIFLYGSGRWSADYYLFKRKTEEEPDTIARTSLAAEILSREVSAEEPFADPTGVLAAEPAMTTHTIEQLDQEPLVTAEARYSFLGWFLFLVDVTPRPKEIVFRHIKTGKIIKRSRDPEVLQRHRYH